MSDAVNRSSRPDAPHVRPRVRAGAAPTCWCALSIFLMFSKGMRMIDLWYGCVNGFSIVVSARMCIWCHPMHKELLNRPWLILFLWQSGPSRAYISKLDKVFLGILFIWCIFTRSFPRTLFFNWIIFFALPNLAPLKIWRRKHSLSSAYWRAYW